MTSYQKESEPSKTHHKVLIQLYFLLSLFNNAISNAYYAAPNDWIIHGVHFAGLSDFSVRGAVRRQFSRQVAQLFHRKFRQ
jgi:hypothetical protein